MLKNDENVYFSYIANEWIQKNSFLLKKSSIIKYSNIINNHLIPEWGNKKITDISRANVISFASRLLNEGGKYKNGLSPKTVNSIISVLKNIFEYADKILGYPVIDFKKIYIKQTQKPIRVLSISEQKTLNKYLNCNMNYTNMGILICLYTGIRIGEICALKWEDISFKEKSIYVHKTMQRLQSMNYDNPKTEIIISTPKSECSVRTIPLPDKLFNLLQENKTNEHDYILTGMPNIYLEPRTMQNRFKVIIKECNIENANFHSLRHTFATRCIELGFDIKCLSEILGHASVNITLNKYVHPSMELKQKNMNMLSDLIGG